METRRRLLPVLGGSMCLSPRTVVNVWTIDNARPAKSTSSHRRPSTSPRRIPVVASMTNAIDKRSPASATKNRWISSDDQSPLLGSRCGNGPSCSGRVAADQAEPLGVCQCTTQNDVTVTNRLRRQRSPAGTTAREQRRVERLDLQWRQRLQRDRADLSSDPIGSHLVADPCRFSDALSHRLEPFGQEPRDRGAIAVDGRPGVGSRRQRPQRRFGFLLVANPERRAWRRRPLAGSGPRSTTNDHTVPLRWTEPFAAPQP